MRNINKIVLETVLLIFSNKMSSSLLPSAKTEEEEKECCVIQISRYSHLLSGHLNPLVYNKGYVSTTNSEHCYSSPDIQLKEPDIKVVLPLTESLNLPLISGEDFGMIKKDSMLSEAAMSNISELTSAERISKVNNIFQLPLFEIHNTMQDILFRKRTKRKMQEALKKVEPEPKIKQGSEITDPKNSNLLVCPVKLPFKSRSLFQKEKQGFEKLGAELTQKQEEYFRKMFAFKGNYLFHVLNEKSIYLQYVILSRENMSFTTCEPFVSRVRQILSLAKNLKKENTIPPCNFFAYSQNSK